MVSPSEFRNELERQRSNRLEQPEIDRDLLYEMAGQVVDEDARQAGDTIVDLVHSGKRPPSQLLETLCLGGAVFWTDAHTTLGEGWPIASMFGDTEEDLPRKNPHRAVEVLRAEWVVLKLLGQHFGKVAVRASDGREAILISACAWGHMDRPLVAVRTERHFMRYVRLTGILWGADHPNGDPMQASDQTLLQHIQRAEKFAR